MCSVCCHKLNSTLKGIPSTTCKYLVHRKCSQLKISEITVVLKTKEEMKTRNAHLAKKQISSSMI